jgi:hypothetical protein
MSIRGEGLARAGVRDLTVAGERVPARARGAWAAAPAALPPWRRVGVVAMLLLGACSSMGGRERATQLEERLRAYDASLRWGYYDKALTFLRARPGGEPLPPCVPREDLHFTAYQARESQVSEDLTEARVRSTFSYVLRDSNAVRQGVDVQSWWYDADLARWFIDGGLPEVLCQPQ